MKSLILVIFLTVSYSLFSQEKTPKGINKIIVKNELSERDNLKKVISVLRENEYSISKIDSVSFQIETTPKKFRNWSYTYYFQFGVFDNKIRVSGRYNRNSSYQVSGIIFSDSGSNEIVTTKVGNSFHNIIFEEMKSICLKIVDESQIQYEISGKRPK